MEYAARHGADAEVLADLRHDAERLARLVDALLALERADAGPPAGEPVALDALVTGVVDEQDDPRVALERADPVSVRGDADALRRAVRNLIENGLVHGPPDGSVVVSLTRDDGRARLSVTDQGPGPDPGEHDRLFERFWRGGDAAGRPGSGLGLAIVTAVARRHGGTVSVRGATFTLELPVQPPPR